MLFFTQMRNFVTYLELCEDEEGGGDGDGDDQGQGGQHQRLAEFLNVADAADMSVWIFPDSGKIYDCMYAILFLNQLCSL